MAHRYVIILRTLATVMMVFVACCLLQSVAYAQGLVGAPEELCLGCNCGSEQLLDLGYDQVLAILHYITMMSFPLAALIGQWRMTKARRYAANKLGQQGLCVREAVVPKFVVITSWLLVVILPMMVHLVGTALINNSSGPCGGL